jgi:hsp70-interacting protein
MQSLLRWSIENSSLQGESQSNSAPAVRRDLDPGIIDTILGRPDAELMKEDLAVALDSSKSEDNRVDALDHLEMVRYSIFRVLWPALRLVNIVDRAD